MYADHHALCPFSAASDRYNNAPRTIVPPTIRGGVETGAGKHCLVERFLDVRYFTSSTARESNAVARPSLLLWHYEKTREPDRGMFSPLSVFAFSRSFDIVLVKSYYNIVVCRMRIKIIARVPVSIYWYIFN